MHVFVFMWGGGESMFLGLAEMGSVHSLTYSVWQQLAINLTYHLLSGGADAAVPAMGGKPTGGNQC